MSVLAPITQRDVAEACGVHPSTICLALKNSPSIPLLTRQRVQAAAQQLGYRPNVAARNLALLRSDKPGAGSLPIAWVNQESERNHWRADAEARVIFDGARRRAEELGYHLEELWARQPGMSPARLIQIVRARGIEGVIFPFHRSFDFSLFTPAWKDFAMVGLNDHRLAQWLDVVCPDYYRNAEMIFRQLRQLARGRIGLVLTDHFDAASAGLVHGCYLRHQAENAPEDRVTACFLRDSRQSEFVAFRDWFDSFQPDVVVTSSISLVQAAHAWGCEPIWVGLETSTTPFHGGADPIGNELAAAAVECVVDKIRRFEIGMRQSTRVHSLKSSWSGAGIPHFEVQTVVA